MEAFAKVVPAHSTLALSCTRLQHSVRLPVADALRRHGFPPKTRNGSLSAAAPALPGRRRRGTSLSAALRVDSQSAGPQAPAAQVGGDDDVFVAFPETPLLVPYPEGQEAPPVYLSQHPNSTQLGSALADYIAEASKEAIAARGLFSIALSGGSLVETLRALTVEPYVSRVDWSKWHILWVDERFTRHTSDDSNFKQAAATLLVRVPVPEDQILPTDDEIADVTEMAEDYEALLRDLVDDGLLRTTVGQAFPRFDLILLGIGPEGHTASLFPNSAALRAKTAWVLPVSDSPKPPRERITMTLPVINSARKVAFVATGEGKAEVVQRVFERTALPGSLPAQLVRPYRGSVTWFVDDASASRLSIQSWTDQKKFPFVKM